MADQEGTLLPSANLPLQGTAAHTHAPTVMADQEGTLQEVVRDGGLARAVLQVPWQVGAGAAFVVYTYLDAVLWEAISKGKMFFRVRDLFCLRSTSVAGNVIAAGLARELIVRQANYVLRCIATGQQSMCIHALPGADLVPPSQSIQCPMCRYRGCPTCMLAHQAARHPGWVFRGP